MNKRAFFEENILLGTMISNAHALEPFLMQKLFIFRSRRKEISELYMRR